MRSYGNLWDVIVDPLNLEAAWDHFRHIHVGEKKIRWWGLRAPTRLAALRQELVSGTYRPGPYHRFHIYEPKPRCICRAPIRDRIVHHALCKVIAPILERGFIDRTYSCRVGKGSHRACIAARRLCARGGYFLKMDVRHYFDTIDLSVLKSILLPMFREKQVRELISLIIDSKKGLPDSRPIGLPLGNLTSQWFANFYLSACDHYATETLGLGNRYIRYMDDILIFAGTAAECQAIHRLIKGWLTENRNLELKEEATVVSPVSEGVPFLGLRIWADRWRLKKSRYLRAHRTSEARYMAFMRGEIDAQHLQQCGRSHVGSIEWYGFKGILNHVGERTLAREGLAAADDGLPLDEKVAEVQRKPFPLDERPTGGIRGGRGATRPTGGAWNYSPASGVTSLGARAANAPSNANNNNGFRLANSMISGTMPSPAKAVSEALQETFLLDAVPVAAVPAGARSGGSWNNSPAPRGVTSLGARAANAPSNANNNNNGFRLASTRTPGVTLPLGATLSPRHDGENFMGQFRQTCAPDTRRRTCTDRTGTSRRARAQRPVRVPLCPCGALRATRPTTPPHGDGRGDLTNRPQRPLYQSGPTGGGRGATRPTDGALVGRIAPNPPDSYRFEKGETR